MEEHQSYPLEKALFKDFLLKAVIIEAVFSVISNSAHAY
jgi:hypothetical protein